MNISALLALNTSADINSIFSLRSADPGLFSGVYLREQGQRVRLIHLARRLTQHTRGLACFFGDGVSSYAQQHNNCS